MIDYWIENPEKRKEYADKYLNSAVAFNLNECMKRMEGMINDAIKQVYGSLPSVTKPIQHCVAIS